MWNLPPPPGFQGFCEDLPLVRYVRHLPHWRQEGATYFATFRLDDALPQDKVAYLRRLREEWERTHPSPRSNHACESLLRETMHLAESWLDAGLGSCRLRDPRAAHIVADALFYFDAPLDPPVPTVGRTSRSDQFESDQQVRPTVSTPRYELGAYVVMPNHVHLIVRPLQAVQFSLEKILQSWKSYTSRRINGLFKTSGSLWQAESFDRIIRDEEHLWRVLQYIGNNPREAKLSSNEYLLWIRPSWVRLGWRFQSQNENNR